MKTDLTPRLNKFLKQVNRKLNLPGNLRSRILADLQVSMADRLETGISEEEILSELGSPAKVAAEFNEQMDEFAYRKSPLRFVFLAMALMGGLLFLGDILITLLVHDLLNGHTGAVGIIGGADGPTSIFVTTTVRGSMMWDLVVYAALIVVGLLGYGFFRKRSKKENNNEE